MGNTVTLLATKYDYLGAISVSSANRNTWHKQGCGCHNHIQEPLYDMESTPLRTR